MDYRSRRVVSRAYDWAMLLLAVATTVGFLFPSAVPFLPTIPAFAGALTFPALVFGWPFLWVVVGRQIGLWEWARLGADASLSADAGGRLIPGYASPSLTGTVSGRDVRVQQKGGYYSVLAELDAEHDAGAIVGFLGDDHVPFDVGTYADRTRDGVGVLASDPAIAEALLRGRSGETLAACGATEQHRGLYVGNVPAAFRSWDPDEGVVYGNGDEAEFLVDSAEGDVLTYDEMDEMPTKDYTRTSNPDTVVLLASTRIQVDPETLRTWTEATAAAADAFERAAE